MTYSHSFAILIFAAITVSAQPRIAADGVRNGASYAPAGFLDSGIAQGSLFVIQGDGLGPDQLQIAGLPLPTALAGVSVTVTASDGPHAAYIYYVSARAVAALLPSGTPLGSATVAVSYQGKSSKATDMVVARRK